MKKNKIVFFKKILIFSSFAVIIISSCKKYEDGPLLSLRTKQHRVCGKWNVDYFSINGYDSTESLKNHPVYGYYSFNIDKGDKRFSYNSYGNSDSDTSKHCYSGGEWSFEDNKKSLKIKIDYTSPYNRIIKGPFGTANVTWEIRKLTEKEMWLKSIYIDGKEYYVKLKQKTA